MPCPVGKGDVRCIFHPTTTTIPPESADSLSMEDVGGTITGSRRKRNAKISVAHKVGFTRRFITRNCTIWPVF